MWQNTSLQNGRSERLQPVTRQELSFPLETSTTATEKSAFSPQYRSKMAKKMPGSYMNFNVHVGVPIKENNQ